MEEPTGCQPPYTVCKIPTTVRGVTPKIRCVNYRRARGVSVLYMVYNICIGGLLLLFVGDIDVGLKIYFIF